MQIKESKIIKRLKLAFSHEFPSSNKVSVRVKVEVPTVHYVINQFFSNLFFKSNFLLFSHRTSDYDYLNSFSHICFAYHYYSSLRYLSDDSLVLEVFEVFFRFFLNRFFST